MYILHNTKCNATCIIDRREASWGHVIRLLYSHIPESAVSYAEMNLNSVLVASPSACAFLVCTIEDTGLFFLQYFARVSDLSSSDKHFTAHSFHYIEFTDTPLVPLITLADLQFLLLLYRIRRESLLAQQAVNRSDQVHASSTKAVLAGFAADPVDTDDIEQECSEERKLQQTRDSRALFLTILVITRVTYLSLYSNREPYAQSDLFNDRLLSVVSGAISQGNSDSDAWLGQARCDVIVALCFSLVQDPAVATECVELLQTKMEDGCDNTKIDSNSPPLTSDHNVWPPIDFSQLTPEFLIRNMISFVFCKYPQLHVMILESLLGHLRRYLEVEEDKQSAEVLEEITVTSPQSSSSPTSSYTIFLEVFLNLFPLHVESVNSIDTHFAQIVPILVQAHIVSKSYKLSSAMDQLEHILTSLVAIGSHILDSTMLAVSRETIASTDTPLNMRTFMVTFLFHVLTKASTDMHAELVVAILPCLHFPVERQRLLMRDLQSTLLLRALDFADEALVILRDAINPLIAAFFDNCNGCVGVFAYQSYVRFSESTQVSKEQSTNLDENKVEGIEGFISFRRDLTVMLNLLWIIELLLSPNTCVESLELLCAELIELQDTSDHINNYNESGTVEDKRKLVMPKSRKDRMVTDYLISLIRFFSDGFYRSNMTIGHLAVAKQILDAFFDILVISGSQLSLTYFKARGISLPVILRARMHAAVVQVGGFVDLLLDLACDSYFNLASLESDSRMPHWPSRVIDHPTFSSAVEAFYPQPSTLHCKTMMVAAQSCYQKYFSTYFSEMFLLLEEFISLSSTSSSKERNRVSSSISTEFNKASSSCPPSLLLGFIGYTCARCLDFPTIMTVYSKFGLVEQEEYMLTYICTSGQAVIAVPDFNSTDANELKSSLIGDIETSDDDFVEQDFLGQRKNKFHSMSNAESEDEESVIIESSSSRHNHNKSTSTGEHNSFQVSLCLIFITYRITFLILSFL